MKCPLTCRSVAKATAVQQSRGTALRWQTPAPRCKVCHNAHFCKPPGPYSTQQGKPPFTLGPTRAIPAGSPLLPAAAVPQLQVGSAGWWHWLAPCSWLFPASVWQLGGHSPSQEMSPVCSIAQGGPRWIRSPLSPFWAPDLEGSPLSRHGAHWQHSATCLKSSSPCSSPKLRRQ